MSLTNRPLLIALLVVFTGLQAWLSVELIGSGFDWRALWGAPIVKATLLDFTFTVAWCGLYLMDTARKQGRNAWAWIPLLLILPTVALICFTLTERREAAGPGTDR